MHLTGRGAHRLRRATSLVVLATSVASPAHAAGSDAPGSCFAATVSSPNSVWLSDTIASSTDVDWFRFSNATARPVLVTLGRVPADYEISVHSDCSTIVASSRRAGKTYEEVHAYLPAGNSFVKVSGSAGAHHASATYALRFRPLAWGVPIVSSSTWTDQAGFLHVVGEVLNNTVERRRWIQIEATLRDSSGRVVGTAVGYPAVANLAPRARSPFEIIARKPAGYHDSTLRVCTPSDSGCLQGYVTTAVPVGALTVVPGRPYVDAAGARRYTGAIRNGNGHAVHLTEALVALYDAYGRVRGVARGPTDPSTLAPSPSSAPFDVVGQGITTPNRVTYGAQASTAGCTTGPRYTANGSEDFRGRIPGPAASARVALTFDMGGRMDRALRIMETLVARRVCATIFPTGIMSQSTQGQQVLAVVKAHPDLFELGNHTMHHCDLRSGGLGSPTGAHCPPRGTKPTPEFIKKELEDAEQWIRYHTRSATHPDGMTTKPYWRAPYGAYDSSVLSVAAAAGWTKQFFRDIDTIDWRPVSEGGPTATSMTLKVVGNATSGSVVLMHLWGYETPEALPAMIDGLRSRGFVLTTLSDMLT